MSIIATKLLDIKASHPSGLDRDELRVTQTGLLTSVIEMTESQKSIVPPSVKEALLKPTQGRAIDIPVMTKGNVTINNARSCSVACSDSDSQEVTVIWKTASVDICMTPSQYANNAINYNFDLSKKISEASEAFRVAIEDDIVITLEANKSQVYNSSIVNVEHGLVGAAIQVSAAEQDTFFGELDAINFEDEFTDPNIKVISTPRLMPLIKELANQGIGNSKNLSYQFAGKDFKFTNRIQNGAGVRGTGYFMPDGSIGLLTRVDIDAQMGHKAGDGTIWDSNKIEGLPFMVGIKYNDSCADESSKQSHLTATKVEKWQISFDYGIVTAFNSDISTKSSSIRKFELV